MFKGKKMAGHMGAQRVTQPGLVVHEVDAERNLLLVRGSVPGPKSGLVEIRGGRALMAVKATVLGGSAKDVALDATVFEVEVKPHLLHETVRSELNAARRGTRGAKSRGLVAGGRAKPWRQKGTGRARQGTIRAPQFTGGGVAFPPGMRSFDVKVNRKARRAALRGALSHHAANGTLAVLDATSFEAPSTKQAKGVLEGWGKDAPVLVVAHEDEEAVVKSFRNLERVLVTVPAELEVAAIVWARAVRRHRGRAPARRDEGREGGVGMSGLTNEQVVLAPVVSEKSYSGIADRRYTFKVHPDAHKTQVRQAVEQLFDVHVERVNIVKVQAKPKRRGLFKGTRPGWKKAIVQVREGETIEIFEGAQV